MATQATQPTHNVLPFRRVHATRLRFWPALLSASLAAIVYLGFYYLTLGHLPRAFPSAYDHSPVGVWADRLDLAQLTGTFLNPPYPSLLNWWIGFVVFGGALVGLGMAYALLLSWATQVSSALRGLGYGGALFFTVGFTFWTVDGFHPGVMRNALPDVGFFMLGWTGWASLQQLACCLLFGLVASLSYRAMQYRAIMEEGRKIR